MIDISSESSKHPPILFTSSIATLGNWAIKHPGEKVPEKAFHDFTIPSPMGYAESKYVAERMLEEAATSHGVSSAICRIGQLGGPVEKNGVWSKQEWLPSVSRMFLTQEGRQLKSFNSSSPPRNTSAKSPQLSRGRTPSPGCPSTPPRASSLSYSSPISTTRPLPLPPGPATTTS